MKLWTNIIGVVNNYKKNKKKILKKLLKNVGGLSGPTHLQLGTNLFNQWVKWAGLSSTHFWKSWIFLNSTRLEPVVSRVDSRVETHFDIFSNTGDWPDKLCVHTVAIVVWSSCTQNLSCFIPLWWFCCIYPTLWRFFV